VTDQDRVLEELQSLRDETAAIRAELATTGDLKAFVSACTDLMRQMAGYRARPQEAESAQQEPVHKVGKLAHPSWGTYAGFREHLCRLEQESGVPSEHVSKDLIASMAGVVPRTINRRMRDWGLKIRRDWPPSTWPKRAPNAPRQFDLPLSCAAAAGVTAVLDLISDGKLDHVFHACKLLMQQVPSHL